MAEHSEENIFSKAIGALRDEKENLLQQKATKKAELEAIEIAAATRKKEQEQREWEHWLESSEELFVKDCFETIEAISVDDFAAAPSGTISFSSEAFIWFLERIHPTPLVRPMELNDLTEHGKREFVEEGTAWRLHYSSGHPTRIEVEGEIQNELNLQKRLVWFNKEVGEIFDRIKRELAKEKFDLVTEDGIDFVLHWRSN